MGNTGNVKSVFWKTMYTVFFIMRDSQFNPLIKRNILYCFKGKESVIKTLNCLGKAAEGVCVGFFAKLKFLIQEGVFNENYCMWIN